MKKYKNNNLNQNIDVVSEIWTVYYEKEEWEREETIQRQEQEQK